MSKMQFVIIGNGIAGNAAALTIRALAPEASITIISEEPYPLYSACILPHYLSGELKRERVFLKTFQDYLRENISFMRGQKAIRIDPKGKRVSLEAGEISYDKLILATGGRPIVPPIKGRDKKGVFTFKSLNDADLLLQWGGRTAVIVGSGPIGAEVAIALKKRNYQVYLIELLEWILPRAFDKRPAALIREILEKQGIGIFTGEKVIEISGSEKVEGVVTDRREIECDTVILAVGIRPEVELAREGGLEIGQFGGIKVDGRMRTSEEDIYACGDCVEANDLLSGLPTLSLLWHNARQQGEIAGYNAVGISRHYPGSFNLVGLNLFGLHAASFGSTETALQNDKPEVIEKEISRNYYRVILKGGMVVGAQVLGRTEQIGVLLSFMRKKENLHRLKDLIMRGKVPFLSPHCLLPRYFLL